MDSVRADKWLWAARFFKTRALAAKACELGRLEVNLQKAKPARDIRVGDSLRVKNEAGEFQIEVLGLSDMRGPATVAQGLYHESEASIELRKLAAEQRKTDMVFAGKPSKQDRRKLDRVRGR